MACLSFRASRHPTVNTARVLERTSGTAPLFTSHMIFPFPLGLSLLHIVSLLSGFPAKSKLYLVPLSSVLCVLFLLYVKYINPRFLE